MNVNRGKMTAAAVLAVTLLVVGGVTGYGLHRAGTVGQPFVEDGRLKVMASFYPMYDFAVKIGAGMGVSCSFIGMAQVLSNIQAIPVWCDSLIPFKCFDKITYIAKTTSIGYFCQS